jgi:hypothetical protein
MLYRNHSLCYFNLLILQLNLLILQLTETILYALLTKRPVWGVKWLLLTKRTKRRQANKQKFLRYVDLMVSYGST